MRINNQTEGVIDNALQHWTQMQTEATKPDEVAWARQCLAEEIMGTAANQQTQP